MKLPIGQKQLKFQILPKRFHFIVSTSLLQSSRDFDFPTGRCARCFRVALIHTLTVFLTPPRLVTWVSCASFRSRPLLVCGVSCKKPQTDRNTQLSLHSQSALLWGPPVRPMRSLLMGLLSIAPPLLSLLLFAVFADAQPRKNGVKRSREVKGSLSRA